MPVPGRSVLLVLVVCGLLRGSVGAAQKPTATAPESFTAAMLTRDRVAITGPFIVRVDRYTPDGDRTKMTTALKYGGYGAFLEALHKSPVAGSVSLGDRKFSLRWAREELAGGGRRITLV